MKMDCQENIDSPNLNMISLGMRLGATKQMYDGRVVGLGFILQKMETKVGASSRCSF
jgi:hypothetical protein